MTKEEAQTIEQAAGSVRAALGPGSTVILLTHSDKGVSCSIDGDPTTLLGLLAVYTPRITAQAQEAIR